MEIYEILLIGIGLAMDAFAVSICKGLSMKKMNWKNAIIIALYFGVFQALMPLIGYFLGMTFESIVTTFDHACCINNRNYNSYYFCFRCKDRKQIWR